MAERQTDSRRDNPQVDAALADYLARIDRGEAVSVEAYLAQHAEIAHELRSLLATSDELERLRAARPAAHPSSPEVSTRSMADRNAETIAPRRVQNPTTAETLLQRLPDEFGRYRIIRPLGSGAMGAVYLAEDSQLHRQVALKTPSFDQDETGELLERFYREARSAAKLRHPNICPVFDVGALDGRHYLSMAYIEGQPLSAYIRPDKLQPERQALVVIRKLALALQEAHDHGIIHRDLKPGNVMIDRKGEPIVMDFGLARPVQSEAGARLTQSGMLVGSPAYMSPEQVEGDTSQLMPATDQYSLGVILYELLTGGLPFRGGITAIIASILTKSPKPPGELRAGLDPRIESLCLKMMAKSPRDRFSSMRAVADAIAVILKSDPVRPVEEPKAAAAQPVAARRSEPKPQRAQPAAPVAAAAASITASNVETLYEAAAKCMRKHDYEQVVQILDGIPEHKRSDQVRALLKKARELSDEVAFLLAEVDEAMRLNDNEALGKHADALLKLKPRHHKALQIKEELSRYGGGRIWKAGGWTPDGRRIGEESGITRILLIAAAVFGLSLLSVILYLRVGDAVVRVQINHPDVEVGIQDRTLNIRSANQDIKVDPGEDRLKVSFQGAEFETDKFTLNKGENPALVVELLDKTLSAKFGDLSIGEWPVEPQRSDVAPAVVTPDAASGAWSVAVPLDFTAPMPESLLTLIVHTGPEGKRDLMIRTRTSTTAPWSDPTPLTELNTSYDDLSPCLSADGLTLIFESDRPGGQGKSDLWMTTRGSKGEDWSPPANLGPTVNSAGVEGLASLSGDGRLLIFAAIRSGGLGGADLWTSRRSAGTTNDWSSAVGLGPAINSENLELAPLLSSNGLELLFTSNRPKGLGKSDLWVTRRASTEDPWPEPENLGPNVNSSGFDYGHVLSPDGRLLLFTSSRAGGSVDRDLWMTRRGSTSIPARDLATTTSRSEVASIAPADAVGFQQHSYKYFGERLSWKEAKARCEAMGGHLPIVETAAENTFLDQMAQQCFPAANRNNREAVWIGATDETNEGDWRWIDGSPVAYTNWLKTPNNGPGTQPNNKEGREHYALIWLSTDPNRASGQWSDQPDVSEQHTAHFICEWDKLRAESAVQDSAGWTDLFNGHDLTGWQPMETTGNNDQHRASQGGWEVRNGELVCTTAKPGWLRSTRQYSDFDLHIEFKLKAESNTDVYVRSPGQGRLSMTGMAIQVIDEHSGKFEMKNPDNRPGAIWGAYGHENASVTRPLGEWNAMNIRCEGARVQTEINGRQLISADLQAIPGLRDRPRSGFIGLANFLGEANGVAFRSIRIREIVPTVADNAGWTNLFNGSDLNGWHIAGDGTWSASNGVMTGAPGNGWIASDREFTDFEMQLEYRLSTGSNSGIFIRIPDQGDLSGADFLEVQLIDESLQRDMQHWQRTGAIYAVQGPMTAVSAAIGQWHPLTIRAIGPEISVSIAGDEVNQVNLDSAPVLGPPKRDLHRPSGHIGFQHRLKPVEFRNIRIRDLAATTADADGGVPDGRYQVLFNKDQGWRYTYMIDADKFVRETVEILGSGNGPQPLTEGRGTLEQLDGGKVRLVYEPGTWNGSPPTEVWTSKGDGTYSSEYWHPAENYTERKPPNLQGTVTTGAGENSASQQSPALPRNEWIDLDPSDETATSWNHGAPIHNQQNKVWANEILTLDNAAVAYNHVRARDVSIKARVKMIEGQNIALVVRSQHGVGGIYAYIDRVDKERVRVAFLNTKHERTLKVEHEFEYEVTAVGNHATIKIDDKTVLEDPNVKIMRFGHVETNAYRARGTFRKIQVKILDQ